MKLLAIDPATHGTAGALFVGGELVAAAYVPNQRNDMSIDIVERCAWSALAVVHWASIPLPNLPITAVAVERAQVYPREDDKSKADPNKTVVPLAMIVCAVAALLPGAQTRSYQPHEWKGNTKKPKTTKGPEYVVKRMARARLTPAEQEKIDWTKSVERSWDVADAIGIGLHHLGRFAPHRSFPRE